MANLSRAVASLRVAGADLLPDEVTAALGSEPSLAYARGDSLAINQKATRVARFGLWSLAAPDTEPADLDAQVAAILEQLTPDLAVWQHLDERFEIDLFCGWFLNHLNEGLEISPVPLKALAERGIKLSLDIYGRPDQQSQD